MVQVQAVALLALCLACAQAEDVEFQRSEQASLPSTTTTQDTTTATKGTQDTLPPELTPEIAAKIPPFPPTKVTVKSEGSRSTVTWLPSPVDTVVKYRIYRKMPGQEKLVKVGETDTARFVDPKTTLGAQYAVTSVNVYGAETPLASTPVHDASGVRPTERPRRSNVD